MNISQVSDALNALRPKSGEQYEARQNGLEVVCMGQSVELLQKITDLDVECLAVLLNNAWALMSLLRKAGEIASLVK